MMRTAHDREFGLFGRGYRARLIVSIAGLLLLVFVPLVLYGIITDRNILRTQFEQTGAYLVRNLARNSETGVFSESFPFLQAPLAAIADKKEVVWAAVYDSNANLIKAVGSGAEGMAPLPDDMQQWMQEAGPDPAVGKTVGTAGVPVLDFYAPIVLQRGGFEEDDFEPVDGVSVFQEEVIGFARVGISLVVLNERTRQILRAALLLAGLYVVAGCWTLFFIQRAITRPIYLLAEGARAIGAGDLTRRIDVHTRDEIEDLAAAFNAMACRLQQAVDERRLHEQQREKLLADIANKNRELENLVYVVSHDLRSPLVNIQGFSQILQQQAAELTGGVEKLLAGGQHDAASRAAVDKLARADMPQSIGFVLAGAAKIDALLNGLLTVSRTGRAPMNFSEITADRLFADILAAQQFQLNSIGATVKLATLPRCHGDEHLLNQVFSNIISNAIKYRDPQRPLVLEISGSEQDCLIVYSIRDNGQGIDERHLERIWNAFYRVDASLPDSGEGIGLAIVKRIVEKHQGRVWVESAPGQGSVFYVELQKAVLSV